MGARMYSRMIQHRVVCAPDSEEVAIEICSDGPSGVEAVQAQQGTCLRLAVGSEIATNSDERGCQFLAVLSVASISETAEPLRGMGL